MTQRSNTDGSDTAAERLEEVTADFQMVDPPVRLELLLEYSDRFPPLPEAYRPLRDAGMNMVHECQSPVFFMVELRDGRVALHADVPPEAPTARGFTSILLHVFDGAAPEEVAAAPSDLLRHLGLAQLLGMQRTRGLTAIYYRLRAEVARQAAAEE